MNVFVIIRQCLMWWYANNIFICECKNQINHKVVLQEISTAFLYGTDVHNMDYCWMIKHITENIGNSVKFYIQIWYTFISCCIY